MPTGDARLGDLAKLRNRLLELDALLKEERKVTSRLRDQSEKKSEAIAVVDAEIAAEMERFRWKREEIIFTVSNTVQDCRQRIESLRMEEKQLAQDLAESDLVQHRNDRLHLRLKETSATHLSNTRAYQQEREGRQGKDFDRRMTMEEMLRKMIKGVDQNYQKEAISKMQLEASQANLENERIHTEFSIREAKTEALIRQQQLSYDQLMRCKIERDVMALSVEVQEKNIDRMTRQNAVQRLHLFDLARQVQRVREEVTGLSSALANKQDLDARLADTQRRVTEEEAKAQEWRKATLRLCRRLLRECEDVNEKVRLRGNARLTAQLGNLTLAGSTRRQSELVLLPELVSQEEMDRVESLSRSGEGEDDFDFDAVWRCRRTNQERPASSRQRLLQSFSM
eukprot:gene2754-3007_t